MKLSRILPLAILPLAFGLMTSCDSTSSSAAPTIANLYLGDGTNTVALTAGQGSTTVHAEVTGDAGFTVLFTITDANNVDKTSSFTIGSFIAPTSSETDWKATTSSNTMTLAAPNGVANGTYKLTLKASNSSGSVTSSTTFTVGGGSTGTATTLHSGAKVANVNGVDTGAYDLINGVRVSARSSDATKDLKDLTLATEIFDGALGSGNGATFVKASSSFDFSGATKESISNAFNAGTASATTAVPSVGDIYLVKTTRSGTVYYIAIKFTNVTAGSATANTGSVTFDYRV